MSLANVLNGVLRRAVKPVFASSTGLLAQQTRNTFILRRKYPIRLHPKGGQPHTLKPKNRIYELVEDTNIKPHQPIDVILTSYVAGVGNIGEKLSIKPNQAYNKLLLPGLAVYATPDNIERYKDIIEKARLEMPEYSSKWSPRTVNVLSTLLLGVVVSKDHPWVLQKYHVRAAFRKINIHVPDYAISMPKNEISGPDLDKQNKEFYVVVTINSKEQVKVRCRLHHYTSKENDRIPYTSFWAKQEPAIFPEDQPVLDAMPGHRRWTNDDTAPAV